MRMLLIGLFVVQGAMAAEHIYLSNSIASEILDTTYQRTFAKEVCGIRIKKRLTKDTNKECYAKYADMFGARLQETYTLADPGIVMNHCKAHPMECHDWNNVETLARELHNAELNTNRAIAEQQRINAEAIRQQRLQDASDSLINAAKGMQRINQPQCQSRRNIFGGYDMNCN